MKKISILKNKKISFVFLVLLTALVLFFSLKDNFLNVINEVLNLNLFWLVLSFLLVIFYWMFSSLAMTFIAKKFNSNIGFKKVFKINIITHFFNAITPFSSGGQPYQIYSLTKENMSGVDSTTTCIQTFVAYQSALILLGITAILFNKIFVIFPNDSLLKILSLIGFIVNFLVGFFLFILAFTKKFNKVICKLVTKLGVKFKIFNEENNAIKKFNESINNFNNSTKLLLKDKKNFVRVILFQFTGLVCLYSVPLVILFAMGDYFSINLGISIVASAYTYIIGAFIPLPGGTGGLEYSFIAFFGNYILGSKLSALMLIWRFITYYFGMIVGAILLNAKGVNKK